MGGGKSASWGGGGGGVAPPLKTEDLISSREGKTKEVDQALSVLRDVQNQYGVNMDTELGIFPSGSRVLGYHDPSTGNIGMNKSYFNTARTNKAYDECVNEKYHPPRGDKTGIEAIMAHEAGHKLNYVAGASTGKGAERLAEKIINDSAKKLGYKNTADMAKKISGYATENYKEAIAEAFADVYCNGKNAKKESRTVVNELNSWMPKKQGGN